MREPHKAPSIAPVSGPQWTEEVEEEAEKGVWDQSFLSFRGPPRPERAQPGQIQAKPGQAEMGRSHASNKSHSDMETLREVLFKQALFHTVSYLPIHGLCHREMMSQQPIMHLSVLISTQSFCLRQPVDI